MKKLGLGRSMSGALGPPWMAKRGLADIVKTYYLTVIIGQIMNETVIHHIKLSINIL